MAYRQPLDHSGVMPANLTTLPHFAVSSAINMANSAGDWGKSNPLAVPEMIQEMKRRGHSEEAIHKVVYENPLSFFRQSARWQEWEVEPQRHRDTEKKRKAKSVH